MTMPSTASELHEWTCAYHSYLFAGGFGPCPASEENLGVALIAQTSSLADDEPLRKLSEFNDLLRLSPEEAGTFARKSAALDAMERQVAAFQEENQISGVIERRVEFKPLGLSITVLEKGSYLTLIGDDRLKIKQNGQIVARAILDLANGAGKSWLRYREVKVELDDGQQAYRFRRDDWDSIEKWIDKANFCFVSTMIGLDLGIGTEEAIELQIAEDELDEEVFTWLLVHPNRERELSDPDLRWPS